MMASLSLSTLPATTTTKKPNTCSRSPLFSKPLPHRFKVSCNAAADDDHKTSETPKLILPKTSLDMQNVDRRNLLLGLGGLYGASNMASVQSALAFPIRVPDDVSICDDAIDPDDPIPEDSLRGIKCCPTPPSPKVDPVPYEFPDFTGKMRVRPKAHEVTAEYIKKYETAVARMRCLPDDHPHSWVWVQQAKVHCAYCNLVYKQGKYTTSHDKHEIPKDYRIQIHFSSLFYPFHRWYLYFYERILGKLISDETFGLPYWNWDHENGMELPAMYEATRPNPDPKKFPLFDRYRDLRHLPPAIIDLQYSNKRDKHHPNQKYINGHTMYNQMIMNGKFTETFFGTDPWVPNPSTPSSFRPKTRHIVSPVEVGVHGVVHNWTGDSTRPLWEDMGNFYSAGYDPIFFAHHANIDRMWTIWKNDLKSKKGKTHNNPKSDDWLNASYVFYDENEKLVRVKNTDCVDPERMGYKYEHSDIKWKDFARTPRVRRPIGRDQFLRSDGKTVEVTKFPLKLDKSVKVRVERPAKNRSPKEKMEVEEMLVLNGIKFDSSVFLKFDVLVNDLDDGTETTVVSSEFAGSFTQVPHHHGSKMFMTAGTMYVITEILEELEAEDDDHVWVTLVPQTGADDVTISEIKIELVPVD